MSMGLGTEYRKNTFTHRPFFNKTRKLLSR